MKLARWIRDGRQEEGLVLSGDVVRFADGATVADAIAGGAALAESLYEETLRTGGRTPLDGVRLIAPLEPASIRDYSVFEQHVEGMIRGNSGNRDAPVPDEWYEEPVFYFSNTHCISGDSESIAAPAATEKLDFELELAAIIGGVPGQSGHSIRLRDAGEHIFGYTIMNDWSARDIQGLEMRMSLGPAKGKDFATSIGPWIVTADELDQFHDANGCLDLVGTVWVNGEQIAQDTFANMAWTFPALVAHASRDARVVPGDLLGSGTMGGGCLAEVWGRTGELSPRPLRSGDTVLMEIEGIGGLSGTVASGRPQQPLPRGTRGRRVLRARD